MSEQRIRITVTTVYEYDYHPEHYDGEPIEKALIIEKNSIRGSGGYHGHEHIYSDGVVKSLIVESVEGREET